jgi:hypothetical protein
VTRKAKSRQSEDDDDEFTARLAAIMVARTQKFAEDVDRIMADTEAALHEAAAERGDPDYLKGVFDFVRTSKLTMAIDGLMPHYLTRSEFDRLPCALLPTCHEDSLFAEHGWTKLSVLGISLLVHTNAQGGQLLFKPEFDDEGGLQAN